MKSLATLIKLYKKRLDDKRLELVREEQTLSELERILEYIRVEMAAEKDIATKWPEAAFTFPFYIENALKNEKKIINLIVEQHKKIEKIRDEIAEEFSELKKYEILQDIKLKEERAKEDKLEQLHLDEIATNTFLQENYNQDG